MTMIWFVRILFVMVLVHKNRMIVKFIALLSNMMISIDDEWEIPGKVFFSSFSSSNIDDHGFI
ncbi:hypothetical protein DERF_010884 [Dermatophagoides farinae]|uniref:Uncharacterized protein n=1 Tax=Dermatophagoides farinae TaxID=6954 RepID=A0A922HTX0_DERFA|nr:hypothetical protein DERF_010884 [Dermatophagoides farinae]